MKFDQIAFYCSTDIQAAQIKLQLGLHEKDWITDTVTADSTVFVPNGDEVKTVNVGELQFNYDLGIEVEILRYVSGAHWHMLNPLSGRSGYDRMIARRPFVSHLGAHLADGEPFPVMAHSRLVQETFTASHTGEYLTKPDSPGFGRKYHYRIFELSPGSYIKYIRRILPGQKVPASPAPAAGRSSDGVVTTASE